MILSLSVMLYALPEVIAPMVLDGKFGFSLKEFFEGSHGDYTVHLPDDFIGYLADGIFALLVASHVRRVTFTATFVWNNTKHLVLFILIFAVTDYLLIGSPVVPFFVPWLLFATLFYLTIPALVCEQASLWKALRRSYTLTAGNRLQFLVLALLYYGAVNVGWMTHNAVEEFDWHSAVQLPYLDPPLEMIRAVILSFFSTCYAHAYCELGEAGIETPDRNLLETFE